ncbi:hypothetical protein CEUSTIGMA_g8804.t1 [Chlamydomonas eustigma]|uniref:Uncharacterized protein n=1 Tax=Chlamydomonas eustigma TaxID=1157962 RepID=A0A250XE74_9CHLO|nr:hypothetical protein CEUSTIGMA_g8804.t1 [Chlamydomonas eustigma]|eukprot:GAX81373.1 hypothetical protein CEUSTIGMA_g8804.t1 [Chlamydomonas eustigma]
MSSDMSSSSEDDISGHSLKRRLNSAAKKAARGRPQDSGVNRVKAIGREVAALIPKLKEMRQRYNLLLVLNRQLKGLKSMHKTTKQNIAFSDTTHRTSSSCKPEERPMVMASTAAPETQFPDPNKSMDTNSSEDINQLGPFANQSSVPVLDLSLPSQIDASTENRMHLKSSLDASQVRASNRVVRGTPARLMTPAPELQPPHTPHRGLFERRHQQGSISNLAAEGRTAHPHLRLYSQAEEMQGSTGGDHMYGLSQHLGLQSYTSMPELALNNERTSHQARREDSGRGLKRLSTPCIDENQEAHDLTPEEKHFLEQAAASALSSLLPRVSSGREQRKDWESMQMAPHAMHGAPLCMHTQGPQNRLLSQHASLPAMHFGSLPSYEELHGRYSSAGDMQGHRTTGTDQVSPPPVFMAHLNPQFCQQQQQPTLVLEPNMVAHAQGHQQPQYYNAQEQYQGSISSRFQNMHPASVQILPQTVPLMLGPASSSMLVPSQPHPQQYYQQHFIPASSFVGTHVHYVSDTVGDHWEAPSFVDLKGAVM